MREFLRFCFVIFAIFGSVATDPAKILEDHLTEVKKITDPTKNPCTHFIEFACGHLEKKPVDGFPYPYKYTTDVDLIKNFLSDDRITSKAAAKVREYYNSCAKQAPADTDCHITTLRYFVPVILSEFHRVYFTTEDQAVLLEIFEEFLETTERDQEQLRIVDKFFIERARRLIEALKVVDDELSPEKIAKAYEPFVVDSEKYRKSAVIQSPDHYKWIDVLRSNYTEFFWPHQRNKPQVYHFASEGFNIWWSHFRSNLPAYNSADLSKCLTEQTSKFGIKPELSDSSDFFEYVTQLAALIKSFGDFKKAAAETERHDEIFKKFGLTDQQTFFLSMAQTACGSGETKAATAWRWLLNSEDFLKSFDCPVETKCFDLW